MKPIVLLKLHCALAIAVAAAGIEAAQAACTIDFENYALNTAVTNQYRGVTFSVLPQTCAPSSPVQMRIRVPEGGTSSGTRCLKIDTGCPDFSDDYLRMVFSLAQSNVSFTLGDSGVPYAVRFYNTNGVLMGTTNVPTTAGVHRQVTVASASRNIRRIEIQSVTSGFFEAIDDLTFDSDLTPPIAEISVPTFQTCVCSNIVSVRGRSCDEESYDHDELHYQRVGGSGWTLVGRAGAPVCTPNSPLYNWNVAAVPDGSYYLRLIAYNECGLSSEAITVVNLNRTVSSGSIRSPLAGWIVGGTICIDGTAWVDGCFDHYTLERRPAGGGTFVPVDPAHLQYTAGVISDPLASWNTATGATPDGDYVLRLTVFDDCGHSSVPVLVPVTVDNTAPVAVIFSPVPCSKRNGLVQIIGTVTDAHLGGWTLQYSDVNTHQWTSIASGSGPVVNGLLANWNTAGLRQCAYALRLIANDQSRVDLDCSGRSGLNGREYVVALDIVTDPLAQDTEGDGMPDAWETAHGFNPNNPSDATLDNDGDGRTNLEEYLGGTDPRNPASVLRITAVRREGGGMRVAWTTVGGHNYRLEGAADPASAAFVPVSPLISIPVGGPSTTDYLIADASTGRSFYRVRLIP